MSIAKINKNIESLEKQLEEIETNIFDPIERLEHKKQLERKIKKLQRTKSQIEQLEKEQRELESLKLEFILNDNEPVDERKSEQVESTASITNNFITIKPQLNLDKEVKKDCNKQVDNIDFEKENSNTVSSVTPVSNNSKELSKA